MKESVMMMQEQGEQLFRRIPSKLVSQGRLPNKAGFMRIEWRAPTNGKVPTPSLEMETMTAILPMDESVVYHKLEEGNTFLFTWRLFDRAEAWYGGCSNGLPFLVRILGSVMQIFEKSGEEAFLDALLPQWVREMQLARFGGPAKRLGPIVTYSLPISWEQTDLLAQVIGGRRLVNDENAAFKVSGTSYRVKGCCRSYNGSPLSGTEIRLAQGVIEGPVHEFKKAGISIVSASKKIHHNLDGVHAVMLICGIA